MEGLSSYTLFRLICFALALKINTASLYMYLEAHWEMYQVKIQVIQLQISERFIQTDRDVLRSVMSSQQL